MLTLKFNQTSINIAIRLLFGVKTFTSVSHELRFTPLGNGNLSKKHIHQSL